MQRRRKPLGLGSSSRGVVDSFPELANKYRVGHTLGSGAFATVRECTDIATGVKYAMKSVDRSKAPDGMVSNELFLLKKAEHPHVVRFIECIKGPVYSHIILEYMNRGTLTDFIEDFESPTKKESVGMIRQLFGQLVTAVAHMHSKGIVHRDLKPDNVLLNKSDGKLVLKVTDFGLARQEESRKGLVGTVSYLAPEMVRLGAGDTEAKAILGPPVDMWALGCILYTMFNGAPPFTSPVEKDVYRRILTADFTFPVLEDGSTPLFPDQARDAIKRLLRVDPGKRLSADLLITHPFLEGYEPPFALHVRRDDSSDDELDLVASKFSASRGAEASLESFMDGEEPWTHPTLSGLPTASLVSPSWTKAHRSPVQIEPGTTHQVMGSPIPLKPRRSGSSRKGETLTRHIAPTPIEATPTRATAVSTTTPTTSITTSIIPTTRTGAAATSLRSKFKPIHSGSHRASSHASTVESTHVQASGSTPSSTSTAHMTSGSGVGLHEDHHAIAVSRLGAVRGDSRNRGKSSRQVFSHDAAATLSVVGSSPLLQTPPLDGPTNKSLVKLPPARDARRLHEHGPPGGSGTGSPRLLHYGISRGFSGVSLVSRGEDGSLDTRQLSARSLGGRSRRTLKRDKAPTSLEAPKTYRSRSESNGDPVTSSSPLAIYPREAGSRLARSSVATAPSLDKAPSRAACSPITTTRATGSRRSSTRSAGPRRSSASEGAPLTIAGGTTARAIRHDDGASPVVVSHIRTPARPTNNSRSSGIASPRLRVASGRRSVDRRKC